MEGFVADAEVLGRILNTLVDGASADVNEAVFTSADGQNSYQICFVPPNTKHLLSHVVGKSTTGYFLIGKALEREDLAVENDQSPTLLLIQNKRVPVGTSISQEIFYLCGSEPLHESHGQSSITECCLTQGSIQPGSLEDARYLLSLHAYLLRNDAIDLLPFWTFIDGSNAKSVAFLATVPGNTAETKTASGKISPEQAHVIFTCSAEALNVKHSLPDLDVYQKQHLAGCRGVGFVATHGYALYEVMGSACYGDAQDSSQSKIIVEFSWDDVGALLQPPPHSCDGVVHIKSVPGNENVATYALYLELQRVEKISQLLDDESELPWPGISDDGAELVSRKITTFIQKLNSGSVFSPTTTGDLTLNSPLPQLESSQFERKDLDFTEQLWLVLKDACDDEDLITSLRIVLSALFRGECQPVIHTTNKTAFAEFMRDLLHCETDETRQQLQQRAEGYSSIMTAIELLVEIGTDKLGRDCSNFLLQEELVTVGQLTPFLNHKLPIMSKVSSIKKLHQIVELVSMAKSITKIGHENLRTLVQQALVFYSAHSANEHPMFSLSLPAFGSTSGTSVKSVCSSSQPSVWCVTMKSKTKRGDHTTMVQLSTHHPTKPLHAASFEPDKTELDEEVITVKEKSLYYLSCARKIVLNISSI